MWSLETYATGERKLCYVRSPHRVGPPVALFHGVLRAWNYLFPLTSQLAHAYELWVVDQRGHGMSDRGERYLTIDYVRDAVAWLRNEIGQPLTLYGHSLGAMTAAGVAAECPDLVRGLVLEDPPFHTLGDRIQDTTFGNYFRALAPLVGARDSVPALAERLANLTYADAATGKQLRLGDQRDPAALRFFAASLRQCDPKVIEPILAGTWLNGYECAEVFANIRCPVLLLQADSAAGGMLTDDDVALFKRMVPDTSHIKMPGVGHAMHWQRTQDVVNLTLAFIESLG